jgi:hypothetical protein
MQKNIYLKMLLSSAAYENKGGWKLDADGKIEMKDGNPVWVDANGGEAVLDRDTISRLNGEAKKLRERAEAAETTVKKFEGLDPDKARSALDTLGKIDQKKLIDAGEVDKVRETIKAEFTGLIAEKDKAINEARSALDTERVNNLFAASEFIRDRIAVPRDMFEATFRSNFKVEDGKIIAYDKAGNRLMSKAKIGEYADTSEALELLVEAHPQKDVILKANSGQGSGSGGGGGNRGGGRVIKRADFEALPGNKQAEISQSVLKGEMQLVD